MLRDNRRDSYRLCSVCERICALDYAFMSSAFLSGNAPRVENHNVFCWAHLADDAP